MGGGARGADWEAICRGGGGGGVRVKHFDVSVSDGGRLRVEVNQGVAGGGENLEEGWGQAERR